MTAGSCLPCVPPGRSASCSKVIAPRSRLQAPCRSKRSCVQRSNCRAQGLTSRFRQVHVFWVRMPTYTRNLQSHMSCASALRSRVRRLSVAMCWFVIGVKRSSSALPKVPCHVRFSGLQGCQQIGNSGSPALRKRFLGTVACSAGTS